MAGIFACNIYIKLCYGIVFWTVNCKPATTMKKLFFTIATVIIAVAASAQKSDKPIIYSIGIHAAIPTGDLSTISGFGYGFSVQGEYKIIQPLGLTGSIGFLNYAGKTINVGGNTYSYSSTTQVPVLVGARFYFNDKIYATGQLGFSFFNNGLGTAFTYAPGIGTKLGYRFDGTLRYLASSKNGGTFSSLDLRVAYNF